jgi:hypothetical protein
MSFWTKMISIGALGVTLLGSVPAWAVSLYGGGYVSRNNTYGITSLNIAPSTTTFCYLSMVSVEETDTGGEYAECDLSRGSHWWTLSARLGKSSDADVYCRAYCYSN